MNGVRSVNARVVTCRPRQRVKTWLKLERALLLGFRTKFRAVPKGNTHGARMKETDEFAYFHRSGVTGVIDELS